MALLATRWIERLLAAHEPPLTVPQYLALRAIAREDVSGAELARRAVSGPAVSQLLAGLAEAGLVDRSPLAGDRRRQLLSLSAAGERAYRSADTLLRQRLAGLLTDLPRPEADALSRLRHESRAFSRGRLHQGDHLHPRLPASHGLRVIAPEGCCRWGSAARA